MKLKVTKRKFGPEPTRKYSEWKRAYLRNRTLDLLHEEIRRGDTLDDTVFRIIKEWKDNK